MTPGAQATQEMYRFARFINLTEHAGATSDERAQTLATRMPETRAEIEQVNTLYVRERYGGVDLSTAEAADARAQALRVQNQMWRTIYKRFIGAKLAAARQAIHNSSEQFIKRRS
ncbi:MAG: hypothetical protein B6D41_13815 [Chloroflexi bacterium UTCFX4]|nr:MAG: hypothetical protein B6D41_13815 [Chloroflexi bacterium UTCFX4]